MCRFLAKCILFIVNLVFTVGGIAIIALGVLLKLNLQNVINELEDSIPDLDEANSLPIDFGVFAYVIIGIGAVIFLIAFCGCCGAVIESKCLLIIYSVFIGVLATVKIVVVILLMTNADNFKDQAESFLDEAFIDPKQNVTFHLLEAVLECCGTTGPDSYNISYDGNDYVAPTCCAGLTEGSEISECLKEDAFQTGCREAVDEIIEMILGSARNLLIVISIAEVLLLIFAVFIVVTSKKR